MYSERMKNIAKIEAPIMKPTTFAPASVWLSQIRSGISGDRERASIARKRSRPASAAASTPIVRPDPQP